MEIFENSLHLPASSKFYWGESPWHKNWKNAFPESYREVTFLNRDLGEHHRADVLAPCGTVIEFQNSPISLTELKSREEFYPKMLWLVNGKKFKGFTILKHLPILTDHRLIHFEFCLSDNLTMVRKKDLLNGIVKPKPLTFHHPELRVIPISSNYYSFRWRFPHKVWYAAKCPLIFDLGGHFLYQLHKREQLNGDYSYLEMISRKDFIARFLI